MKEFKTVLNTKKERSQKTQKSDSQNQKSLKEMNSNAQQKTKHSRDKGTKEDKSQSQIGTNKDKFHLERSNEFHSNYKQESKPKIQPRV